jgi:hypothetical protein
MFKGDDSPIVK